MENQSLVDNPDIALIKEAIGLLEKEIEQLSKLQQGIQQRLKHRNDKRLSRKLNAVIKEHGEKIVEKQYFEQKLKSLPNKISIVELLKGKKMSRSDLEEKSSLVLQIKSLLFWQKN